MTELLQVAKWFLHCPNCNEITEFHEVKRELTVKEAAIFRNHQSTAILGLKCQRCGYMKPHIRHSELPEVKKEYQRRGNQRYRERQRERKRERFLKRFSR